MKKASIAARCAFNQAFRHLTAATELPPDHPNVLQHVDSARRWLATGDRDLVRSLREDAAHA